MHVEIVLTPAEIARLPQRDLRGATCVVFDVLRATSTMLTAFAYGARRIYPVRTIAEARELRRTSLPEALLGGERHGVRIEGFDLGNSPLEYTADQVADQDIVMTTTNGTVALQACAQAAAVYAGAFLNLDALADALGAPGVAPAALFLICAGSGEDFALEDGLAAAALLARLATAGPVPDAGRLLEALHRSAGEHPLSVLQSSSNGRRLAELGLAHDVEYCARVSSLNTLAIMRGGILQSVGNHGSPTGEPGPGSEPPSSR